MTLRDIKLNIPVGFARTWLHVGADSVKLRNPLSGEG